MLTWELTEPTPGILTWQEDNGYTAAILHFSSDPEGRDQVARQEGTSLEEYEQEHNLSFTQVSGKSVFQEFDPASHLNPAVYYAPGIPVWRGIDFGYHRPAIVYSQCLGDGAWWALGEILGQDTSLAKFLENEVFPYEKENFPDANFVTCADPAGKQVSDKSEHSSFAVLANYRIFPYARKTEINEGLTLIRNKLHETVVGRPGLLIHPDRCPILAEGLGGGYHYPEVRPGKPEPELPEKDGYYDHVIDAFRYVAVNNYTLWVAHPKAKQTEETRVDKVIKKKHSYNFDQDDWS